MVVSLNREQQVEKYIREKYGVFTRVTQKSKTDFCVSYSKYGRLVNIRSIYDCSNIKRLLCDAEELHQERALSVRARTVAKVRHQLINLNLPHFVSRDVSLTPDCKTLVFRHTDEGHDVRLSVYSLLHEDLGKSSLNFLRTYLARHRFGPRHKHLKFSDLEWSSMIHKASEGLLVPHGRYIPWTAVQEFGPSKLRCLKCNNVFNLSTKIYSTKIYQRRSTLNCPECSPAPKRFSSSCNSWLKWIERLLSIKVLGAHRGGEKSIRIGRGNIHVDGFHSNTNTVFEYHGSRWHGSPLSYPILKDCPHGVLNNYDLYIRSSQKEVDIELAGYNYIRIWDFEFDSPELLDKWIARNKERLCKCSKIPLV